MRRALLVLVFFAVALPAGVAAADDDEYYGKPEKPITTRGDRYVPKAAGTVERMRLWFGPYVVPPGHDANRVDLDLPLTNGYMISAEPGLRRVSDVGEPSHQEAHIHHAHWFAVDPGNEEDNYTGGNTEWIFGNGDEETKADFRERSEADPNGPNYGQYIGAQGPQLMIYMLHNKTSQPLEVYVVLDIVFAHGTKDELAKAPKPYHDVTGVLFGRTFDVPRNPQGDGIWTTTRDHPDKEIEWTSTVDGTIIGTGGHLHPGGLSVVVENMGSKESPCPNDGLGTGGTRLLKSDALWRDNVPFTEDFQMEVSHPAWRAPVHKGDRIRITGIYENRDHAWYTAMTHDGLYIDEQQKPQGRCKPYLINQPAPKVSFKKVKKKIVAWKKKRYRSKGSRRWRVKLVRTVKTKWVRKKVVTGVLEPSEGVPNRPWALRHKDVYCGVELGGFPCDKAEADRGEGRQTSQVVIADFLYLPGDMSLTGVDGAPARVKQGTPLTFVNADQNAGIRHSVTTCRWPCNGPYVANYPLADGVWDSTTLGYDAIDGGNPNPVAATPADLQAGKYAYFCRIHPWMRGAFEVVP
jgi:plastocyanin